MTRLLEIQRYDLPGDLFAARVRGQHAELVVNLGYEGLLTLDGVEHRTLPLIAFPGDDFSIYSWGMSPRGDVSIAFSGEPGEGVLLIDHERGSIRRLSVPKGLPVISELMWFSPSIGLLDYEGGLWTVEGTALRRATESESASYLSYFHRRVLASYAVVKTDPYERGVYVRSKEYERKTIGFMPYDANVAPLLMDQDGTAIDVTRFGERLFVSFEAEVVLSEGSSMEPALSAAEGELFVRVNVIEVGDRGYLSVVSSAEDHLQAAKGRVTFYEIVTGE